MQHSALVNPFEIKPEASPRPIEARANAGAARSAPACSNCSSDDIVCRCTAQWSIEAQEWQLTETFAQPAHCNTCNGPCQIMWLPLN